jgi:septal ring factor EnvC (AmiA/AmiB activator)
VVGSPESRVRNELALVIALALSSGARAGAEPSAGPHRSGVAGSAAATDADAAAMAVGPAVGPIGALVRQLAGEAAVTDRARATVAAKLAATQATRVKRLRAAVRLLRPAPGFDPMEVARRRAAARLLVARDGGERALLALEAAQLRAAHDRIAAEIAALPSLVLPGQLARPAPGKIARRFGTLAHERSKTTLSRRGIDIEVDDHSPVIAPAAGTVRYAGPIRGLDQGVILDHGAYLTVVAKLGEIALPVDAPIAAGDRIGRAARRRVYFEVRVKLGPGGLPIDPEPLLGRR